MRLLLDTHALLWWMADLRRLGPDARAAIDSPDTEVHISGVSVGEIEVKRALGKLEAPNDLLDQVDRHGFTELPLTIRHAVAMRELPLHHKDPFDRMLIAQARVEDLTLVTADRAISDYDVRILPASK